MKNLFLLAALCYFLMPKIASAQEAFLDSQDTLATRLRNLKEVMQTGTLTEKGKTLKELATIQDSTAFTIAAIELSNHKWITKRRQTVQTLITIDVDKAIPVLKSEMLDSLYNRRLEIIFGIADVDDIRVLKIIDKYQPQNLREKVAIAYIKCKYFIGYKSNFSVLVDILTDKALFNKQGDIGEENCLAWDDAASYLGKLGDVAALPFLKKAKKWADGVFGENIMYAIYQIEQKNAK
jgi:transcriptional regulator